MGAKIDLTTDGGGNKLRTQKQKHYPHSAALASNTTVTIVGKEATIVLKRMGDGTQLTHESPPRYLADIYTVERGTETGGSCRVQAYPGKAERYIKAIDATFAFGSLF